MSDRVEVQISNHIADVRLTRSDKLNAFDRPMFDGLIETAQGLAKEPSVRAVVLSGEGRAFSAGLDFASMGQTGPSFKDMPEVPDTPANWFQAAAFLWRELPMPVIAAVQGVAYGAGMQLALSADIRFVTPDAKLSLRELHWGLIPDMSATQTLRSQVRLDVAKELIYTARVVSGAEAVELGLATHVTDSPHEAALELAHEIAARNPTAVRAAKELLETTQVREAEAALALEQELQARVIGKPNQAEAVKANMEKRQPEFGDAEI
ncbi:MAG: crotonase/enoyl-CoA hydratase family protein [Myxococcota bacterium]